MTNNTIFDYIVATNPRGNESAEIEYPEHTDGINYKREQLVKSNTTRFGLVVGVRSASAGPGCGGVGICSDIHDSIAQCMNCCGTLCRNNYCIEVRMSENHMCY